MTLDASTLMAVTVFVALIVGILFLLSWSQARRMRALAILGVAHLLGAAASALLCGRGVIPDVLSIGAANAMMLGAYGLIWCGARSFAGRRTPPAWLLAGPLAWLTACAVPAFYASIDARVILASSLGAFYCAAAAAEIWRGRKAEPLVSRYPAALLLASEALLYAVRVPVTLAFPLPRDVPPAATPWVAILCFAALLYTVAIAFLFMALAKERLEREQRLAAQTDPLTGIANRRAFEAQAAALLARGPATLLLFDIDHFKRVNDTYGHGVGDAVLVGFCAVVRALLPADAPFGRVGGEEFACLLPGSIAAGPFARTVLRAVAGMRAESVAGLAVTVSIGGSTGAALDDLLARADRALYRAKALGRDRVVFAEAISARERAA
ncbi:GGDEF domain-containing protein [Methylobacterium oryzisoli]|uniref:GGDEF domain-containing protein n=1 Tax=Methylobacterium oryzisoli TaxID=3385502 RepID=UPI0038922B5F